MKNCLLPLLLVASLSTGCAFLNPGVKVPKTDLKVSTDSWDFRLKSEKDTDLNKLQITIQTNGSVVVSLDGFKATNSPIVIKETGTAQSATIDAQGRVVDASGKIIGEIVDGVLSLYGKP